MKNIKKIIPLHKEDFEVNNKIIIDVERLRYPNSGLANVCKNLVKGLNNTVLPYEVTIYGPEFTLKELNTKFVIKPWKSFHKIYSPFLVKYKIIHTTHQLSSYFRKKNKKSVKIITLHDLNFLHENLSEKKKNKILSRVNANLKNTDYVVCISQFVKDDVLRNASLLELKNVKEITVIHNGIVLPESRAYLFEKYAFLKDKKYILNIGVLIDKKNQLSLIEMLPFVQEDLVLLASGEKESYVACVRNRIKELGLEQRVHFLSNVSEEEKYAIIQHCEAMCHPSLAEGFGIPPIEAMAFGKPVFLSNLTSLPEIGGKHAFYFDSFETQEMVQTFKKGMELYAQNPELYGQKLKDWAKQFDFQAMAKKYLDLYTKIFAQK